MAKSHPSLALHISLACITTVALVIWLGFKSYVGSTRRDLELEYSWIGDDNPLLWPLPESEPVVLYPEDQHRYTMYGPNSKAEWAALVPRNGTVRLGPHGRTFSIAMFHQLRCLDMIREAMVHMEVEIEERDPVVDHCVNYLRQIVLCHAHTAIESSVSTCVPSPDRTFNESFHQMSDVKVTEGTIPFAIDGETYQTWYKLHGDLSSSRPPLVVLHGGPGLSHDYLNPIADLAQRTPPTPVLFYDQLGGARSTHLPSKPRSFWTLDLFIAELENVLAHFNIAGAFDLLGHSWGAVLGSEFVVRHQPKGLRHLVLANGLANSQIRNEARKKLLFKLPEDARKTIVEHEAAGTTTEQVYKDALRVFYATFACTLDPPPPELIYSISQAEDDSAGGVVLDNVRKSFLENDWDITDRLHLIHVPTLLINGENDYMTDDVQAPFFQGIAKVKWVKFAKSSHVPHWEERERYMDQVSRFLEL
ncbi:hypothetical protein EVG20_g6489 [Dentipellis fragilis]|uniref:AB hydrolase-1 domain-containing protein n=1 Tax=Dentipellis fragilis TaxID=205917 RepID=A0A4Y9YKE1_9AGAM|nr:hypothetical protein EVG20_g6489 [Dentipellis fragilis]